MNKTGSGITYALLAVIISVVALGVSFSTVWKPVLPAERAPSAQPPLGAIPGTEISGNTIKVGGVTNTYVAASLYTASSTICAFRGPTATSTLRWFKVVLSGGLPSGSVTLWKTSGSLATQTSGWLMSQSGQNRLMSFGFIATGTGQSSFDNVTFATTTYLVLGTDVNFTGSGRCEAKWDSPYD